MGLDEFLGPVGYSLAALDWAAADGCPLEHDDVQRLLHDTGRVLGALGVFERDGWRRGAVTDGGREFTRAMLQTQV